MSLTYEAMIPAWNAARTIRETVGSVLGQTVPPARVIVVDDGSTDGTAGLVAGLPGVEVLAQPNQGPARATNHGLSRVAAPVAALLDADDLWFPDKMERQLAVLEARPEVGLVFCGQRQFRHGEPDDGTGEVRRGLNRSSLVMRMEVFHRVGEFVDPPGRRGEMIDWIARAREAGVGIVELPEVLVGRRILPGSLSWGRDPARDVGYLAVAHAALLRRRARTGARTEETP
jgi:glycosyltransferase involved in cell wall biosynthesis